MAKPKAEPRPALPEGSDRIAAWARQRHLAYEPYPNEDWFRAWEPFDTMVSATAYYNAVSSAYGPTTVTVAEPWLAPVDATPLDRTLYAFISNRSLRWRAACRGGDHFNTRVSFLENPPPPRVSVGDANWDQHVATFAASSSEADRAFPAPARQLLASWGFRGHIEARPGGLVVHFAGTRPVPEDAGRLLESAPQLVAAFVG